MANCRKIRGHFKKTHQQKPIGQVNVEELKDRVNKVNVESYELYQSSTSFLNEVFNEYKDEEQLQVDQLVENQPATKKDLSEFKSEIKKDIQDLISPINTRLGNIENQIQPLHNKLDSINHRTGIHRGFIWVYGIVLTILLTGGVNLVVSVANN